MGSKYAPPGSRPRLDLGNTVTTTSAYKNSPPPIQRQGVLDRRDDERLGKTTQYRPSGPRADPPFNVMQARAEFAVRGEQLSLRQGSGSPAPSQLLLP